MLKSKKSFAFCVTILAVFSAISCLAPITALADETKEGETKVTYNSAPPKPAAWGITVPSIIDLGNANYSDKGTTYACGSGKLGIVDAIGSVFADTKDRTFSISAVKVGNVTEPSANMRLENIDKTTMFTLYAYAGLTEQATPKPSTLLKRNSTLQKIQNIEIYTNADKSLAPDCYVQFSSAKSNLVSDNWTTDVTWTATEK